MENLTVDSVYGKALYEALKDTESIDDNLLTLKEIKNLFETNPDLLSLLKMPTIDAKERKQIIESIFDEVVSKEITNFLYILIDKRRIGQIKGIISSFEKICDENNGVTNGEIVSAVPLNDIQLERFEKETSTLLNKKVKLGNSIDESILGGVVIYFDGKLIDASLRGRLEELKEIIL